jgi:hypothetical protein
MRRGGMELWGGLASNLILIGGERRNHDRTVDADTVHRSDHLFACGGAQSVRGTGPRPARLISIEGMNLNVGFLAALGDNRFDQRRTAAATRCHRRHCRTWRPSVSVNRNRLGGFAALSRFRFGRFPRCGLALLSPCLAIVPVGLQIIGPVPSATCWDREFADSPLERTGFEPPVPLLQRALLLAGHPGRRHENRNQLAPRGPLTAVSFSVGPRVRIRLPPAGSQERTAATGHPRRIRSARLLMQATSTSCLLPKFA